jgi:hypothetical protein
MPDLETLMSTATLVLRKASAADAEALRRLAALDSAAPLHGAILVGEVDGTPVAAIQVDDGRVVADPFEPTATVVTALRRRAGSLAGTERRERGRSRFGLGGARLRPRFA